MANANYQRQTERARALGYSSYYAERAARAQSRGFANPAEQTAARSEFMYQKYAERMRSEGRKEDTILRKYQAQRQAAKQQGYDQPTRNMIWGILVDEGLIDQDDEWDPY